jgi:hypothetical protein
VQECPHAASRKNNEFTARNIPIWITPVLESRTYLMLNTLQTKHPSKE